jgi:plastocyanin
VLFVVGGVVFFIMDARDDTRDANEPDTSLNVPAEEMMEGDEEVMEDDHGGDAMMEEGDAMMDDGGEVKIFNLDSSNFKFSVTEIKVKKGDTVKITLTNSQGFHNWVVDEFDASTKQIKTGETDTIEFVADATGIFEYYCSVGNHRQLGMVGTFIVE